jgi:hypothetical protein
MFEAIAAVRESYTAFTGNAQQEDWLSNGRAWYKMFYQKYKIDSEGISRDPHVREITERAFALCVDAVQRRSILKIKFLPRRRKETYILGGGEDRSFKGKRSSVMVLAPPVFASNADIRDLMASESFVIEPGGDKNIYLRLSFRESQSELRYIIVALYILWMQEYIKNA